MLHKETVSPFLYETLVCLMKLDVLKDYRLVGGTALSLMLGHRKSLDIDMFSPNYIEGGELKLLLQNYFPRKEIRPTGFGVSIYFPIPGTIKELKADIGCNEENIRSVILEEGIRIAHIEEIAAMKLEAITTRQVKKDYWDIAEILAHYTFKDMTMFYQERYPYNDLRQVIEKITSFEPCEKQDDPECLNGKTWGNVKDTINAAFDKYISQEINENNSQGMSM